MLTSGLLFIVITITMMGLIQAEDPPAAPAPAANGVPPGSTNPPTATPESATDANGATSSTSIFNDQIFLLDAYAQEGFSVGPKAPVPQVPPTTPFDFVNEILQASAESMQTWMQNITPFEYAQLIPKIILSVVNTATMTEFTVPLANDSDIEGAMASEYWLTTRNIGLKSFNMKLDGNTNPVGGKIYNIDLSLIFDSINTFFGPIASGAGLQYSDIFRSQRAAGSAGNDYKLKLSVSYSGPQDIMAKYSLTDHGQIYTSYLTLIKTKMKLDENMKTQIDVHFQGYEESMLSNNTLFDVLKLRIQEAQAAAELAVTTMEAATKAQGRVAAIALAEAEKTALEGASKEADILAIIQGLNTYEELIPYDSTDPPSNSDEIDAQNAEIKRRNDAKRLLLMQTARQADEGFRPITNAQKDINSSVVAGNAKAEGVVWDDPTHPVPHVYSNTGDLTVEEMQALAATLYEQMKNGELGEDQSGASGSNEFANKYLINEQQTSQEIRDARAENDSAQAALNAKLRETKEAANAGVQHIRMTQLRDALADWCFGDQHKDVWQKIALNATQIQDYMSKLKSGALVKNYTSQQGVTPNAENPSGGSTTVPSGQTPGPADPPTPTGSGTEQSAAALEETRKQIAVATAKVDRLQAQADAAQTALNASLSAPVGSPGRRGATELLNKNNALKAELNAARAEVQRLTGTRGAENANLDSLGSKAAIQTRLTGFSDIEYIFLGDFISLTMKRLISTGNARTKPILTRTRCLLTKIALASTPMSITKVVDLYKLPISKPQIQKWLSDLLYGNFKTTLTLFECFRKLTNIVSLAQQRKARIMSEQSKITYTVRFIPYALIENGSSYSLATAGNPDSDVKHALIFATKDTGQAFSADLGGGFANNFAARIPHFYLGGQDKGIVKKFDISEIQDEDIMKVQMEKMRASGQDGSNHIAALFEISLSLLGTPFFHLGQYFYVEAPTINLAGSTKHWFHLQGYYSVKDLTHAYTTGGGYVTTIKGYLQSPSANAVTIMTAQEFADAAVTAAMAENPDMTAAEQAALHAEKLSEQEKRLDTEATRDAAELIKEAEEAERKLQALTLPAPPAVIDAAGQAAIKAAGEEAYNARLAELRELNGDDAEKYDDISKLAAEEARANAEEKATIEQQAKADEAAGNAATAQVDANAAATTAAIATANAAAKAAADKAAADKAAADAAEAQAKADARAAAHYQSSKF